MKGTNTISLHLNDPPKMDCLFEQFQENVREVRDVQLSLTSREETNKIYEAFKKWPKIELIVDDGSAAPDKRKQTGDDMESDKKKHRLDYSPHPVSCQNPTKQHEMTEIAEQMKKLTMTIQQRHETVMHKLDTMVNYIDYRFRCIDRNISKLNDLLEKQPVADAYSTDDVAQLVEDDLLEDSVVVLPMIQML